MYDLLSCIVFDICFAETGVEVGGCIVCYLYVYEEFGRAGRFNV